MGATTNRYPFYTHYWPTRPQPIGGNYFHTWCLFVRPSIKQKTMLLGAWWVNKFTKLVQHSCELSLFPEHIFHFTCTLPYMLIINHFFNQFTCFYILIYSADPQSWLVGIIVFAHVFRPSVRPSVRPHCSKSSKTKQSENNVLYWQDCGSGRVDHWRQTWFFSFVSKQTAKERPSNNNIMPSENGKLYGYHRQDITFFVHHHSTS